MVGVLAFQDSQTAAERATLQEFYNAVSGFTCASTCWSSTNIGQSFASFFVTQNQAVSCKHIYGVGCNLYVDSC